MTSLLSDIDEEERLVWLDQFIHRIEVRDSLEMLLDAKWVGKYQVFVKKTYTSHPNGLASYRETFYNERGEEVPRPKGYKSA